MVQWANYIAHAHWCLVRWCVFPSCLSICLGGGGILQKVQKRPQIHTAYRPTAWGWSLYFGQSIVFPFWNSPHCIKRTILIKITGDNFMRPWAFSITTKTPSQFYPDRYVSDVMWASGFLAFLFFLPLETVSLFADIIIPKGSRHCTIFFSLIG